MAVAVDQRLAGDRAERQLQAAGLRLALKKFLEQHRMRADALCVMVGSQRQQLVPQRQKTARLQSDDRHAARGEWRIGRDEPIKFFACVIDEAGGKECSSAAKSSS